MINDHFQTLESEDHVSNMLVLIQDSLEALDYQKKISRSSVLLIFQNLKLSQFPL